MNYIIKANDVSKKFGDQQVLSSLSAQIKKGEIYGLLGKNGAGKTTFFKIMTGLLRPDNGEVEMLGLNPELQRNKLLKKVGFFINTPVFYENVSAQENLSIHLAYMDLSEDKIKETLKLVGLPIDDAKPVRNFSLGMRQRLALARAIIHDPEVLILDEPINGLDPKGIRDMRILFKSLAHEKQITIILSSHILSEMELVADRIAVLTEGKIVKEQTLEEYKEEYGDDLEEVFIALMEGDYEKSN